MKTHYTFLLLAACVCGVLLNAPHILLAGSGCVGLFFYACVYRKQSRRYRPYLAPLLVLLLVLNVGSYRTTFHDWSVTRHPLPDGRHSYGATLLEKPENLHGRRRVPAKLDTGAKVYLSITHPSTPLRYGDHIRFSGRRIPIEPPTNPGQFDYQAYLHRHGFSGTISVSHISDVQRRLGNPFKKVAIWTRKQVHHVFKSTLSPPYDALLIGLVFGEHGARLPEEIEHSFRHVGLTHLLVVSGSQVALLSGMLLTLCRGLGLRRRRIFWVICIGNLVFYFMTGGGASILRAVLMNCISVGLWSLSRRSSPLHICALTALIMMMINPYMIVDPGAQLSFLATFSLMFGAPALAKRFPERWPNWLCILLSTAIAPFLWTTPLTAYLFNNLSPISVISNMIAVQAIELLVVAGFISALLGMLYLPLSMVLNNFCFLVMAALKHVVHTLSILPGGSFYIPKLPLGFILMVYAAFFLCTFFPLQRRTKTYLLVGLFISGLLSISPHLLPSNTLIITAIDVGQGDATLIRTPGGKTIIIDGGNRLKDWKTGRVKMDMGKRIVYPVLNYYGINKLDMVIVTHFDSDHVGGIPYLLEQLPVGALIDNGRYEPDFPRYNQLRSQLGDRHITPKAGDRIPIEHNLVLTFYHPFPHQGYDEDKNNNSLVFKLTYNHIHILFTGDLEAEKEALLAQTFGSQLKADILKLGHHGSRTSTIPVFLRMVSPTVAFVSAGRHNRFHHPHHDVMTRVESHGIPVLRTDTLGAIHILTDGHTIRYQSPYAPPM